MDTIAKLELLGRSAQHDLCTACGEDTSRRRDGFDRWIYPAVMPDGKRVRLLKILLTNVCEKNCYYCNNRAGRDVQRVSFSPEEMARTFDQMQRANLVEGLFLSSGVCAGSNRSMDRMIACVELLRDSYAFSGYIHLKLLPGATDAHIERAMQIAHRVSVNLEAPNAERLGRIAPVKDWAALARPIEVVNRLREASGRRLAPAGQTTQYVVGAAGESDQEILSTTTRLYDQSGLSRAYFSAFQPIPGTPLENVPATPTWREHRLYQSDWLLRFYGFHYADLIFDTAGNLPRQADPKQMYAYAHPERYPIEVNRASREELLRVPGLGPKSVARLVEWRRQGTMRELSDLKKAGAVAERAAPYVLLDGRQPPHQLPLWEAWPED
jgi:putative DNA modification/repair radical SAM protein